MPEGYVLNREMSNLSIVLAPTGNVLNVYYDLVESVLTVTAKSENITNITATSNQFGFSGKFEGEVYTASVKYGATVTLSATPAEGYKIGRAHV